MASISNNYSFPFTTSTINSLWTTKGWTGLKPTGNQTITKLSSQYINIGGVGYDSYDITSNGENNVSNALIELATGDMYKGNFNIISSIGTKISNDQILIYKPISVDSSNLTTSPVLIELIGWIKKEYNGEEYYYPYYTEVNQYVYNKGTWSNIVSPTQTEYQPYEPVNSTTLGNVSAILQFRKKLFNSVSSSSFVSLEEKQFTFNDLLGIPEDYYTEPGKYTLTFIYTENSFISQYTFTIFVNEWENNAYKIVENPNTYNVYVGKEIGDDFLNHFMFLREYWNDYHPQHLIDLIHSSLDKECLSITKFYDNQEYVEFTYTYDENTAYFVDKDKKVINLYDGNAKFNGLSYKTIYQQGETIVISDISISGSLIYSDGSSINLLDVDLISTPIITTSLGTDNEYYLDETISNFTITYEMSTKYFGTLTFTYTAKVSGQTEDYITRVELINETTNFHAGELLYLGDEAKINCYNANNEIVEIIESDNFSGNITEYPTGYRESIGESLFVDGVITLIGKFRTLREWVWNFYVTYSESSLKLSTDSVKKDYYVNTVNDFSLDTSNIVIKQVIHQNDANGTTITEEEIEQSKCSFTYNPLVLSEDKITLTIKVSYTNSYNQTMTSSYNVNVIKIKPETLIISGDDESIFYDNTTFKYPVGLTFTIRYTDGSEKVLDDYSNLEFYRNEELSVKLTIGESIIRKSDGTKIYVLDPTTNVSGYYYINFEEDYIVNVYLDSDVSFTLGNKFYNYKNLFQIKALYKSGIIGVLSNYTFKNNDYILEETDVIVVVDEVEWTLDKSKITFLKPKITNVILELNGFKTSYNNQSDTIDARNIVAKLEFENADYIQTCSYLNDITFTPNYFQILSSDTSMATFIYDGSTNIDVDMENESTKEITLTFSCKSIFNSQEIINTDLSINVIEITEVTGISIISVYNNYYVGDKFLNENDDTIIQIYYKDVNQIQKKFNIKLNSGFSAINVYPTKNSVLNSIGSRTIRITSASNINVAAEYTINVSSKYLYDNTISHDLVAIEKPYFVLPDGEILLNHYVLIERIDENGLPNTQILDNGKRVIANGKNIDDLYIYGYLEDIFDETKNARVIFFDDFVPPVDGSNNIEVTYPCYVPGNAEKINKCHFGILFGNNNSKNRLFVSGNSDIPNCDWHSGSVQESNVEDSNLVNGNFGYFEDTSWCYYGETDNEIVGYDIVSNDKLLVLKNKSDKETSVYFRTPTLVTAIDGSGTQMVGIDGETLYQEEFSLIKGNNSIAGISPKSIINFNGDSLFLSNDNNLVGLDLIGIIGDNQRYANTRSYYIDEDLKKIDLSNSWLWSDNKNLFLCLNDKTYITNYETKQNSQYEWWVIDVKDIQAILKIDDDIYFGNSNGEFFKFNKIYDDIRKIFVGVGGGILASEGENDNTIIVSKEIINQLDVDKKYKFSIIPTDNDEKSYMYYSIGNISNVKSGNLDFYVNITHNALELLCLRNGVENFEEQKRFTSFLKENTNAYLNHIVGESNISCASGSELGTYYKKYYLKRYIPEDYFEGGDLYKLYDRETNKEIKVSELYRAVLCYQLNEEYEVVEIDKDNNSFKLQNEGEILDLVRYAGQLYSQAFKGEIKIYEPVQAFYITKPYTLGDLNYFKTIWQFTINNDTNIPSELNLAYASNKIPYESTKTLAKISVDKLSFSLNEMNFNKIDFDKTITPRTYTINRILPKQKFVCFGFKNYNNTNSVLSSMSIIYSIPHASYSGD